MHTADASVSSGQLSHRARRLIRRVVVDKNHLPVDLHEDVRELLYQGADILCFVERWDNDRQLRAVRCMNEASNVHDRGRCEMMPLHVRFRNGHFVTHRVESAWRAGLDIARARRDSRCLSLVLMSDFRRISDHTYGWIQTARNHSTDCSHRRPTLRFEKPLDPRYYFGLQSCPSHKPHASVDFLGVTAHALEHLRGRRRL